jgi:glycosyltransferase involved in cell wall biosynthesis
MHILFLTDNFPPEVNAPATRVFEHCREWVKANHRVTVITCAPNFPKGEVFEGYRNELWRREWVEGIEVIRVWSYITANEGVLGRIIDYQSFMVSAIVASLFVKGPVVVVGTSPQFFTGCAAYAVSRLKGIPFIFEVRDLWPESIKAVGAMKTSVLLSALEKLEHFLYRKAAKIVSVTHASKRVLIGYGIDSNKIEIITNGVDLSRFKPMSKDVDLVRRFGLEGKFVVGYVGTHGMAHALETLLDAADRTRESDVAFLFVGDGARKQALREMAERMKLDNVWFIDTVPRDEVARYWSLLDTSIIHLRKTELFTTVIPSKLFECMGMGIPVLLGVEGEAASILERERIGRLFQPENAEQLCAAIEDLTTHPDKLSEYRANCIRAAESYDRTSLARKMLASLEALAPAEVTNNQTSISSDASATEYGEHRP